MSTESRPQPKPASDFWTSKTAEQLAAEQGVGPFDPKAWEGAPDITDEELEWWLQELRRMRSEEGVPRAEP
jgi:hypothetical protein